MNLGLFPWDKSNSKPYWINPENGYEWWVEQSLTDWCSRGNLPPLEAVVFMVATNKDGVRTGVDRILMDLKTNEPLYVNGSLEFMTAHIDMLRIALQFNQEEE